MAAPEPDLDRLVVHSHAPLNAEPPPAALVRNFTTHASDFYVRSHGNTPALDAATHRLRVGGKVARALDLGLDELRTRFPAHTVTSVMQCAGNRRSDLIAVRPVDGDPWGWSAIGNAEWTGVRLLDLLEAAGAEMSAGHHVALAGLDEIEMEGEGRFTFEVSIPIGKAVSPEVLIAYAMNGHDLPADHGYPLRAVVPGFAGVRSTKWLSAIEVRDEPSSNHMQQRDYKMLPADIGLDDLDWSRGVTIYDMPLNSAICEPAPHAELKSGRVRMRGYAIGTAREIARVDVSTDGGRTWSQATVEPNDAPWGWSVWHADIELPQGTRELAVRAWDSAGQTQPAQPDDVWNVKGYLSAAWHRIPVSVR